MITPTTPLEPATLVSPVKLYALADLLMYFAKAFDKPQQAREHLINALDDDFSTTLFALGQTDQAQGFAALQRLAKSARVITDQDLLLIQTALFQGPAPCPVYQGDYIRRDKGPMLADIAGFYLAFGLKHDDDGAQSGDRPDLFATELEFLALASVMCANAQAEGNLEAAQTCAEAIRQFVTDHLGEWIIPFTIRMGLAANDDYHQALAQAIHLIWPPLIDVFGWPIPSDPSLNTPEAPEDEDDTDMSCGAGPNTASDGSPFADCTWEKKKP